jgi:hypothetical protein
LVSPHFDFFIATLFKNIIDLFLLDILTAIEADSAKKTLLKEL